MAPKKAVTAPAAGLRRSARLNPELAAAEKKKKPAGRVTKPKSKAQRAPPVRYECLTCGRSLASRRFPDQLPTARCQHLINTCKDCSRAFIAAQLESVGYDQISCPECPEILNNDGVKLLASKEVHKRVDDMERRGTAEKVPGWRWCMNPRCRAGQVHEPSIIHPRSQKNDDKVSENTTVDDTTTPNTEAANDAVTTAKPAIAPMDDESNKSRDDSIFTCNECGAKACVPCDRPYHDGETCEEYQKRRKQEQEVEDQVSEDLVAGISKKCPNCQKSIEKAGGCDYMLCTQCWTRFCFVCLATYPMDNAIRHNQGCIYANPAAIDPHAMLPAHAMLPGGVPQ